MQTELTFFAWMKPKQWKYIFYDTVHIWRFLIRLCKKRRFLGVRAEILCTTQWYCITGFLCRCRASFRVCAEILVLGRNIHLCKQEMLCSCITPGGTGKRKLYLYEYFNMRVNSSLNRKIDITCESLVFAHFLTLYPVEAIQNIQHQL